MTRYWLTFDTLSDSQFGRGDGVAGLVDAEVQHDEDGLPYLGGRTLKGLLAEVCADILFSMQQAGRGDAWAPVAHRLFGAGGSTDDRIALLHIGDARLPQDLRSAVQAGIQRKELDPQQVLESLTAIRRQTAIDPQTGAPRKHALRAVRVVLRKTPFAAELIFEQDPEPRDLALLAACVAGLRRAGTGRNRGKGLLRARLCDGAGQEITGRYLDEFEREVCR